MTADMARCGWLPRTLERAAHLWGAVRRSYIFILITWNIIMKRRRVTRQVIIKTSVASVLVAVVTFLAAYSAVLLLTAPTEQVMDMEQVVEGRRGRLLWSYRGRSRLHSRYDEDRLRLTGKGGVQRTPPSPDWGYAQLVNNITLKPPCPSHPLLLILITSAPANRQQRALIRKTWCSPGAVPTTTSPGRSVRTWRCIFLLGETQDGAQNAAIQREARERRDMLVGRYSDSYRNLTYKVITGLHWAVHECQPKFILKTDDDCFVNSRVLVRLLEHQARTQEVSGLYVGNVFMEQESLEVIRNPVSKWAVSREDYAPDLYPQYASGTGYILSLPAAQQLLDAGQTYRPFPNEDAYVGVLAESVGVSPVHSHRFTFVSSQWTLCNFLYLLVIHRVSLRQQTDYFNMTAQAEVECANQPFYDTWN